MRKIKPDRIPAGSLRPTSVLRSSIDASTNFLFPFGKGTLEARYVNRGGKVIAYLSSHSGCKMGCKFCFLTNQNQLWFDHTTIDAYREQLDEVLNHALVEKKIELDKLPKLNINFMARGEALANKFVINNYRELVDELDMVANSYCIDKIKMNISTIMPHTIKDHDLNDVFGVHNPPHLYYSLYSLDEKFRKHWMPNAIPVRSALDKLKKYENSSHPVTFHYALIKDHNDSLESAAEIVKVLREYKFVGKFNLVRYNPHPSSGSTEADEGRLNEVFNIISDGLGNPRSYIVPKVGKDVYASCGMFSQ
jgi:adenine C2-methylase RlmN of 23S rRNA A2503 and tRNA A37